jgi:hypothetical protein
MVMHRMEVLGDDMQFGIGQQMVDVGDSAGGGILDRNHRQPRLTVAHGGEHILEGRAGQRLHLRIHRTARHVGICAGLPLIGDEIVVVGRHFTNVSCRLGR